MIEKSSKLKMAYRFQKARAIARSIPWEFSFDTWMAVWGRSGKLSLRGKGLGKYVMARRKDAGPYSESNVDITLYETNARDARINKPTPAAVNALKSLGKGRGWTFARNKFQVIVSGKYIGRFDCQSSAEAAYKAAVVKKVDALRCAGINPMASGASGKGAE